jgi:hypothetical protein
MSAPAFIRPELRAALRRWREALAGAGTALVALWAWVDGIGIVAWLAVPLGVAGAALIWTGVVRGRLRGPGTGPGVVDMTEGQLAYFGPLDGGVVALDEVQAIAIDTSGKPRHWVLDRADGPALHIPVTAKGADKLIDAFAALPGFRLERAVHLRGPQRGGRRVVWRRSSATVEPLAPGRRLN